MLLGFSRGVGVVDSGLVTADDLGRLSVRHFDGGVWWVGGVLWLRSSGVLGCFERKQLMVWISASFCFPEGFERNTSSS